MGNSPDPYRNRLDAMRAAYEIIEGPFSDEEYDLLVRWRKTGFRPTTASERARFEALTLRFFTQVAATPESEGWHEAGHAVVAHALGFRTMLTFRHPDGTPAAMVDNLTHTPPLPRSEAVFLQKNRPWALVQVAGYLAEQRAVGRADPVEATPVVRRMKTFLGYSADEQAAYLAQTEAEASAILITHEEALARLAALLSEEMHRTEAELRAAIVGIPCSSS